VLSAGGLDVRAPCDKYGYQPAAYAAQSECADALGALQVG
jgi:hypothetical protein